ncbi:MAG: helix-hairpin-helix domain-containing protein [Deltaproteobacteria bacterium]|nr:helix-hairpin-helix domain-containing protein [Deltaproteobacteria bacterium]
MSRGEEANLDKKDADGQARNIALLIIALFLFVIYFWREFSIAPERIRLSSSPLKKQTIVEIEEPSGLSRVYSLPEGSEIKNGSKITLHKDGAIDVGLMSGEKHIIFSIPLDINKAAAQDFEALPDIGPKLAERIVETRERLGGFKTVRDLKRVKGIGDKKLKKIQEWITVESNG